MAQISLYVDEATAARLSAAARARNLSLSKYVANVVAESLLSGEAEETQKKQLLADLLGALDDPTYTEPPEIPMVAESHRRYDLI